MTEISPSDQKISPSQTRDQPTTKKRKKIGHDGTVPMNKGNEQDIDNDEQPETGIKKKPRPDSGGDKQPQPVDINTQTVGVSKIQKKKQEEPSIVSKDKKKKIVVVEEDLESDPGRKSNVEAESLEANENTADAMGAQEGLHVYFSSLVLFCSPNTRRTLSSTERPPFPRIHEAFDAESRSGKNRICRATLQRAFCPNTQTARREKVKAKGDPMSCVSHRTAPLPLSLSSDCWWTRVYPETH